MDVRGILVDSIGRSREVCHQVLDGLSAEDANWRPTEHCNSVTWLVWHLARQQDVQIAHLGGDEVWLRDGWVDRFALDLPRKAMGYGHRPDEIAKVVVSDVALLAGYLDAATDATVGYLAGLDLASLDDIVDTRWTPHVTRGVRLVSIVDDAAQHAGQAAYVRGLCQGWRTPIG